MHNQRALLSRTFVLDPQRTRLCSFDFCFLCFWLGSFPFYAFYLSGFICLPLFLSYGYTIYRQYCAIIRSSAPLIGLIYLRFICLAHDFLQSNLCISFLACTPHLSLRFVVSSGEDFTRRTKNSRFSAERIQPLAANRRH